MSYNNNNNQRHLLVLFDGVCGLCSKAVSTLIYIDPGDVFLFAPLQSKYAKRLLSIKGRDASKLESVYVVENFPSPEELEEISEKDDLNINNNNIKQFNHMKVWWKSRAVSEALKGCGGMYWCLGTALNFFFPRFVADFGYDCVAKVRYTVWGKFDQCTIPNSRDRHKFLKVD
eukprot:gb/GECH01013488.1/.p1 GENE.gb/GECH01013488.1/~~gb/GECH01013488.1/.p1  ORF type:complete len:173 (+),score=36.22 gb/GECH01013488.1/:1-519(+)